MPNKQRFSTLVLISTVVAVLGRPSVALITADGLEGAPANFQTSDFEDGQVEQAVVAAGATLHWELCTEDRRVECGHMQVPLDWKQPWLGKITIAVNRLRAADRGHRLGSLVIDPGGPGGSGQESVFLQAKNGLIFTKKLSARFDLIGLDPRGVGSSNPVRCDPAVWNKQPSHYPTDLSRYELLRNSNMAVFKTCEEKTGPLLGHIDTISVARDIEALRVGLNDGELNYLGQSYGAQLGSQYAALYPKNIRAMVLDGNLDHSESEVSSLVTEGSAYEDELRRFFRYCQTTSSCALFGKDAAAAFDELVERADQAPLPAPACAEHGRQAGFCKPTVSGEDIRFNMQGLLLFPKGRPGSGQPGWDAAGQAIEDALERNDASRFAALLATKDTFTLFEERGVECMDWTVKSSKTFADLQAKILLGRVIAPHTQFASQTFDLQTRCLGWGLPVQNPPRALKVKGAPPILMVNATHDPSTSVVWAVDLKQQLPSAVLLLREGDGHTSYVLTGGGENKTVEAMDDYLITLETPPPNTVYDN